MTARNRLALRWGPRPRTAGLFLLVLLGGCGSGNGGAAPESDLERVDSAGIEVVSNRRPGWERGEEWRLDPTPTLRIGASDGPAAEALHGVTAVRPTSDGVLVAQQSEIRLYDHSGLPLRRLGGAGEGPGEFRQIADALACDGHVYVAELYPARITRFEPSGEPSTIALPPPSRPGMLNPLAPLLACTAHTLIGIMSGGAPVAPDAGRVRRPERLVVRMTYSGGALDTLFSFPGSDDFDGLAVPFRSERLIAWTDSAGYLVDSGSAEIRVMDGKGALVRLIRLPLQPRPVGEADIERIRAQYLQLNEGGLPAAVDREVRSRLDAVPIPATMPHFSALELAPDGTIWLRDYQPFRSEATTGWTLVGADGAWLGRIELPDRFTVHALDEHGVLGVWRDELDVEEVRRYRISAPHPPAGAPPGSG